MNRADLIVHPIRLRILMTLAGRSMTTREISQSLPDISQASVYRHVQLLWKHNLLRVVEEVPVRGMIERVYTYSHEEGTLTRDDTAGAANEDYLRYFSTFVNTMIRQYRLYLQSNPEDPRCDGVAHWGDAINLSKSELEELKAELKSATTKRFHNPLTPDRKRYIVSRIVIPDFVAETPPDETTDQGESKDVESITPQNYRVKDRKSVKHD